MDMEKQPEFHRNSPPPEETMVRTLRWVADAFERGEFTLKEGYLHEVMVSDDLITLLNFRLPVTHNRDSFLKVVKRGDAQ